MVLSVCELSGPEHSDVISARHNLARWSEEAGEPCGARDQYADLLPVIDRVPAPEHPWSLAARNSIAY